MIKRILPWLFVLGISAVLIVGFAMKDTMNDYLSKMMRLQAGSEVENSGSAYIDSLFNYTGNGKGYQVTFLEFGANCPACKRMEPVMEEIRTEYPEKVNVVFLNVTKPENQVLVKYYGVATIPMQILLDQNGKEFFRHSGYMGADKLKKEFCF